MAMVKMTNDSNLQVTFSKRRSGLFKKASELCTLCGADVAIVVFSPGRKVFSFGHPCVEAVVDRFLTRNPPQNSGTMQLIEAHRNASVRELNVQLTQVTNQLEAEKKRGEELNRMRKTSRAQCWWEGPVEEMELTQLEQLKASMEELKKNVSKQVDRVLIQSSNPAPFFGAGSSGTTQGTSTMINNNGGLGGNVMNPHNHHPHHAYNRGYGARGFF